MNRDRRRRGAKPFEDRVLLWSLSGQSLAFLGRRHSGEFSHPDFFSRDFLTAQHGWEHRAHDGGKRGAVIVGHPARQPHHHRGKGALVPDKPLDRSDAGDIGMPHQLQDGPKRPPVAHLHDHALADGNPPPQLPGKRIIQLPPLGPIDQDADEGRHGEKMEGLAF